MRVCVRVCARVCVGGMEETEEGRTEEGGRGRELEVCVCVCVCVRIYFGSKGAADLYILKSARHKCLL